MKSLKFDRASHPAYYSQSKTLGQLMAILEKHGERDDLFISKVWLNEKRMDEDEENLLDGLSINEIQVIQVEFSTMQEIVVNTMTSIIASIQETQMLATRFAREFRNDKKSDEEKIKYLLVQCRNIVQMLEELFQAHTKKSFLIKHISLWFQSEQEFSNVLQCLLHARKMTDFGFIADILDQELVQSLEQWEDTIEKELFDNSALTQIFKLNQAQSPSHNRMDV